MEEPGLSVIICTYGRSAPLARCLEGLARQTRAFDLIIVDSASREPEGMLIAELAQRYGARHIRLMQAGLSRARNAGLAAARTSWLAYIDDDAVPAPDWAEKLVRNILLVPDAAAIGGSILPDWEVPLPSWWPRPLVAALTILDWHSAGFVGESNLPLHVEPYGANLAFHRETLEALGGFPECLGRQGDCLLSNEETYVVRRLGFAKRKVLFAPEIIVHHHIARERLTPDWLLQRQYWSGISEAVLLRALGKARLAKALRMMIKACSLAPLQIWPPGSTKRLAWRCSAAFARGFLRGLTI